MKFLRPLLALIFPPLLIGTALLWWNLPSRVDLVDYAPADSILYLEFNNLAEVADVIRHTDAWKAATPISEGSKNTENRLMGAAARAGIGPVEAVVLARAQLAMVVVGLQTAEQNDTLKIRPEVAIIVETHTSKWRTKPAAVDAVKRLANFAYGTSTCTERSADANYIECSASGNDRKLVGAVSGTLLVLGNTARAVQSCLEVRRGVRPSLRTDAELLKVRNSVAAEKSLGFGYISSSNSARLLSWAAPVLMGRAPGDHQFEQLLAVSAGRILRGVAWTSISSRGGIEDRFLFSLEPEVVSRLQPAFETADLDENFWKLVPNSFQSLTIYRSKEPAAAWSSLDSAVSMKLDALPAVLFGSLLKSSLSVYGISDPRALLNTVSPPLLTMKPSTDSEGSLLLARVRDEKQLRESLVHEIFKDGNGQILDGVTSDPNGTKEFAALLVDGYLLMGKTGNMQTCLKALRNHQVMATENRPEFRSSSQESSAAVVTYSNDEARLNRFISTISLIQGKPLSESEVAALYQAAGHSSFSSTETSLNSLGIERKTHSAFGQFSTFISLLQPESSTQNRPD